ncbi:MAG: O-antigen ligase family protein [Bacteroidaceae bacterium]|nr:O-antigen ligase family protein [Bacteroidaceae bacterium]
MSELVTHEKNIHRICSLDIAILLFACLLITGQYVVGGYTSLADCASDIKLRNSVLILFYYSISRLLFQYYQRTAYLLCLSILLLISLKESYLGMLQLYYGAEYPVGSMSNTNLFGCFLTILCSILAVIVLNGCKVWIKIPSLLLIGLFIVLIGFTKSRLALLALIIPTICYFCLSPRYSAFVKKHIVTLAVVLVSLFAILYYVKKPSADGRFYMAKIALRAMPHNGVWGGGIESFSTVFGDEQIRYFSNNSYDVDIYSILKGDFIDARYACSPLTAFNEFLRIGVEHGFLAMLLSLYIIFRAIWLLIKNRKPLGYGLISLFLISLFSYPHCYSNYCLSLSMFLGAASSQDNSFSNTKHSFVPLLLTYSEIALFGIILFLELPQIERSKELRKGESDVLFFFNKGEFQTVCNLCDAQFDKDLSSGDLIYAYGISLSKTGSYEKSDSILRLGISRYNNPSLWREIGHNHFRHKQYKEAETSYIKSFLLTPHRITPLMDLAELYHYTDDKEKLEAIAIFSDKFTPKIQSNTVKEYHNRIKMLANGE